jgi:hypothetical protein
MKPLGETIAGDAAAPLFVAFLSVLAVLLAASLVIADAASELGVPGLAAAKPAYAVPAAVMDSRRAP